MTERRRTPSERRAGRRAPFVAAVRQEMGAEVMLAQARNLGETGMELRCVPPAFGSGALSLAFELPDGGELVEVSGAVVFERCEGRYFATGVKFENISHQDRQRIARFVDEKSLIGS